MKDVFADAKYIYLMQRNNTLYHPAYVEPLEVKCDLKGYVVKSADGVRNSVIWFNEDCFDAALKAANESPSRGIPLEKDSVIVEKGTVLWKTMVWSEKFGKYVQSITCGVYRKKEHAVEAVKATYDVHRRFLQETARMASVGIDKVGLPEKEFVDFEKPGVYKEFI